MRDNGHIAHAAIRRLDGVTAKGRSHSEIIASSPHGTCKTNNREDQGFLTSKGLFVSRIHAYELAFESGQITEKQYNTFCPAYLLSEYLWSDSGYKYDSDKGYYK